MSEQISFFPDVLGTEIERIVNEECERTQSQEYERYVAPIKSLHEGYGYTAEGYAKLTTQYKRLKDNLNSFLTLLSSNSDRLDSVITEMYGYAQEAAKESVRFAAIIMRTICESGRADELNEGIENITDNNDSLEFEETE